MVRRVVLEIMGLVLGGACWSLCRLSRLRQDRVKIGAWLMLS